MDTGYDLDPTRPNAQAAQARYADWSDRVAKHLGGKLDISYGSDPRQCLDVFGLDAGPSPAILFFHGGYWRAGSKDARRFPAAAWRGRGIAWIPVQYRLTPTFSLGDLVEDARRALCFLADNASRFGIDPAQLHMVGNSAGGHLAAMAAAVEWGGDLQKPAVPVASLTALSGLFDLVPLASGPQNEWLHLTSQEAAALSPINVHLPDGLPVLIAWGEEETDAFKAQASTYAGVCRNQGADCQTLACAGHDHFSIIGELGSPGSPLFEALGTMIDR